MMSATTIAAEKLPNRLSIRQKAIEFGIDCLEAGEGKHLQTRNIAAKIGVSVGSFYNLFGDIDTYHGEIFAVLFEELLDIAKDRLAQDADSSTPTRMARLAASFWDVVTANEAGWRALLLSSLSENCPPKLAAQESEWRTLFVEVLQQGSSNRASELCVLHATILWGALRGMALQTLMAHSVQQPPFQTTREEMEKLFAAMAGSF